MGKVNQVPYTLPRARPDRPKFTGVQGEVFFAVHHVLEAYKSSGASDLRTLNAHLNCLTGIRDDWLDRILSHIETPPEDIANIKAMLAAHFVPGDLVTQSAGKGPIEPDISDIVVPQSIENPLNRRFSPEVSEILSVYTIDPNSSELQGCDFSSLPTLLSVAQFVGPISRDELMQALIGTKCLSSLFSPRGSSDSLTPDLADK